MIQHVIAQTHIARFHNYVSTHEHVSHSMVVLCIEGLQCPAL